MKEAGNINLNEVRDNMSNMKIRFKVFWDEIRRNTKRAESEIRNKIDKVRIVFRSRELRIWHRRVWHTNCFTESKMDENYEKGYRNCYLISSLEDDKHRLSVDADDTCAWKRTCSEEIGIVSLEENVDVTEGQGKTDKNVELKISSIPVGVVSEMVIIAL